MHMKKFRTRLNYAVKLIVFMIAALTHLTHLAIRLVGLGDDEFYFDAAVCKHGF
jgi:hypothetical protein